MVTQMVILLQKNYIHGYYVVPLLNQMNGMLNVLKLYRPAFATNRSLKILLQVLFFGIFLPVISTYYHRTRVTEINMEISGQVKLDLVLLELWKNFLHGNNSMISKFGEAANFTSDE